MGSKRRRLFNELNITSPEFKCNKDHYQIIENINKTHIEQLKKELAECSKIEKEESLSQIEDKLIKKRLSDIDFNEQRKLKKATKYVNKEKLKLVLNDLKTPIKLLHEENCSQFDYKEIHWTSPTYIIRHIRNCILNHDWNNLTHLLLLLIKHGEPYICLVKEVRKFEIRFFKFMYLYLIF